MNKTTAYAINKAENVCNKQKSAYSKTIMYVIINIASKAVK